MSVRPGAPYQDRVEAGGKVIVYEGHDIPRTRNGPDPKKTDQTEFQPNGRLTQNGLFMSAVRRFKTGLDPCEQVRVFEKIRDGIWAYNGIFNLVDGWYDAANGRRVYKFKLEITHEPNIEVEGGAGTSDKDRVIPTAVKLEVWKRDKGCCAKCGSKESLHFDHVIPYSQGGSSKDSRNIQVLCAKHNLAKRDNIE
jgi:hypothetical protein